MNYPQGPGSPARNTFLLLILVGLIVSALVTGTALLLIQAVRQAVPAATAPPSTPAVGLNTSETLQSLQQAAVPIALPGDIAGRLQGKPNIPNSISESPPHYEIGARQEFWLLNDSTSEHFKVQTQLVYITDHLYFWVDDGQNVTPAAAKALGDTFETKIYPTDRAFFGSEWTPGVDNDPHLYIVFAGGLSARVGAYFSAEDEVNPAIDPYSNGHELFVVNAGIYPGAGTAVYGVLAHEFQHMIEYNQHRNMEGWMDEGFSVLATYINGYGSDNYEKFFFPQPDIQLNDFPIDRNSVLPHYGASFMFLDYFLNRFGEDATSQLAKEPADGLDAVDASLKQIWTKDGSSGKPISADDMFADWTVANYLGDPAVDDGRYAYRNFPSAPKMGDTTNISRCPAAAMNETVHQYGADYIRISCRGDFTLTFQGQSSVPVLPVDPHSGNYDFYSNKGDNADTTLTHSFDFSTASGAISMNYWTWYEIEKNYDYVYLEASVDGRIWQTLRTTTGTSDNPGKNNLGIGYTGDSGNWTRETVDLSSFAGKRVQLRFEYITDAETYGEGFLLDDISIPQIGYQADFEKDSGGWIGQGFVRIQNFLPQTYRLTLIDLGSQKSVQTLALNSSQGMSLPLHLENDMVLIVSGTARYTRQLADYLISLK